VNLKSESRKFGRFLRRHARLTLPESVKVAKWCLRCEMGNPPSPAFTRYQMRSCGCCWAEEAYLPSKTGGEVPLERVWAEYSAS
jgi:hypothetical protein